MMNVLLIVLYKENLYTSKTLKSLLNCDLSNVLLVIWDNSPYSMSNSDKNDLKTHGVIFDYIHTPSNLSLSAIYNNVIDKYKDKSSIFIFDQDTYLDDSYFAKMALSFSQNLDVNLFLPYVLVGKLLVSPGRMGFYKGMYEAKIKLGLLLSKNVIAVASGMAIRMTCFTSQGLSFNEHLSFYGIDTKFCLDYSKMNKYICVVDYCLDHDLSQFQEEKFEIKQRRFNSLKSSALYILRKESFLRFCTAFVVWSLKTIQFYITHYFKK